MKLELDPNLKYILACSGGSDSMALLSMAKESGISFTVAHVNYHLRDSSARDEEIVRKYCEENALLLRTLSANYIHKGNKEDWARNVRYQFFYQLVRENGCDGVIVAHHKDDSIETYLLQKERKTIPLYWGLSSVSSYNNQLTIYRPLLSFSKKELEDYCKMKEIPYGVDETNFILDIRRNQIRHQNRNLSEEEKEGILKMMESDNEVLSSFQKKVRRKAEEIFDPFDLSAYKEEDVHLRYELLRYYFLQHGIDARHYSIRHLNEFDQLLLLRKNSQKEIGDKLFSYSYGKLRIEDIPQEYAYTLQKAEEITTPYFRTSLQGETVEAITLSEDDFPITIRNYHKGDAIVLRYGTKSVSRFFIDRKIDYYERRIWPVVINHKNEVIFVSQIGCSVSHYSNNPNLFVIK